MTDPKMKVSVLQDALADSLKRIKGGFPPRSALRELEHVRLSAYESAESARGFLEMSVTDLESVFIARIPAQVWHEGTALAWYTTIRDLAQVLGQGGQISKKIT